MAGPFESGQTAITITYKQGPDTIRQIGTYFKWIMPSGEVEFNNHQSFTLEKSQIPDLDFSAGFTES